MRAQPRQSQARRMPHELHEHSHRRSDEARWTCPPEPAAGQPPVDVRDMIVVHTALLREFRLAPAAVTRVPAGDRRRAATVSGHLGFLCDLLHHHHQGEDELLWPTLRVRVPAAAGRLIDDAEAQHHGIDDALRRVQELRTGWTADPSTERGAKLATQLENLHALLGKHLDFEERALLPLAASTFTEQEWRAIGEAAVATTPKPQLVLSFGMFAYEGDAEVLRDMLSSAPALPRMLLPRIAPRVYARRARAVHGTAQP
jgi:hemerythrin-like domain-containing protein